MRRPKSTHRGRNHNLERMVRSLDDLAALEEFREQILPALRKDLSEGKTEEEILSKYKAIAAAKLVSLLNSREGDSIALSSAKEILNRTLGMPVAKTESIHKLGRLPDEELDAMLLTKLNDQKEEKNG